VRAIVLASGSFFFRRRNTIFPIVIFILLVVAPPRPTLGDWRSDQLVNALGIGLAILGQALRVLVIGLAYIRRGGKGGKVHADTLVVDGIFAHSRNPLYLGNLLILGGMIVVANSPALTWIGVPFFAFAYGSIIAAEEQFLSRKFGAPYEEYRRRVPLLIPRITGLLSTLRSMKFDWQRVLRKEYGSIAASTSMFLAVVLWEAWIRGGAQGVVEIAPLLGIVVFAVLAFYGTIRVLKKSGRLRMTGMRSPAEVQSSE
jgi:protein-S-isoprenylcysteine O-methyltransferase Ste14